MICLNPAYATTRRLTSQRPEGLKELSSSAGRVEEGGLRNKGYFKVSLPGKPLITIITVVRDRAHCFEHCIKSVINQSYDNVEYIVIDGASTDGTLDLLHSYDGLIDYWVSEPDQGLYHAMNKAVGIAGGDWLYFIGSDDVMMDCLSIVAPQLLGEKNIYYGNVHYVATGRSYNGPFSRYKLYAKGINHQGIFYPNTVFKGYRYDDSYKILADRDLTLKCFIVGGFTFNYLPIIVADYNDVNSLSVNEWQNSRAEYHTMIRKRLGRYSLIYSCRYYLLDILQLLHCKNLVRKFLRWLELRCRCNSWRYQTPRF